MFEVEPEYRDCFRRLMHWRAEGLSAYQPSATHWVAKKRRPKGQRPVASTGICVGLSALERLSIETQPFGLGWYACGPSARHAADANDNRFQVECWILTAPR
jgi:hypothetical protein